MFGKLKIIEEVTHGRCAEKSKGPEWTMRHQGFKVDQRKFKSTKKMMTKKEEEKGRRWGRTRKRGT